LKHPDFSRYPKEPLVPFVMPDDLGKVRKALVPVCEEAKSLGRIGIDLENLGYDEIIRVLLGVGLGTSLSVNDELSFGRSKHMVYFRLV
jgi:hypothetical protein